MAEQIVQPEFSPAGPAARWDDAALLALAAITVADLLDAAALWRAMAPKAYQPIIDANVLTDPPGFAEFGESGFIFVPSEMAYHTNRAGRRRVADAKVKDAFLLFLLAVAEQYYTDALQMLSGAVPLAEWQAGMARKVKRLHLASAMLGWGGMNQLPGAELATSTFQLPEDAHFILDNPPTDTSPVFDTILYTLGRLGNFANQIAVRDVTADTPEKVLDRAGVHRSGKPGAYAAAAHGTFEGARVRSAIAGGVMLQYRNMLHPAEHCIGENSCPEQTDKGWVSIGALVPIGERPCLYNCRCSWEFRRKPEAA